MKKQLLASLLLLALAIHGQEQEQKRLAIVRTVDDGDPSVELTDLNHLTVKLREIAGSVLQNRYGIMSEQSIVDKLGKDNAAKACKEAEGCLAQLGRKINADYIGQARLGRFGGNLTIGVELYNSATGIQIGTISGEAKDLSGLLAVLNTKAPVMFGKMPGISSRKAIAGGISGWEKKGDYEIKDRLYLVNLSTDPAGASLSFNGVPSRSCQKTPCKAELGEGSVRIIAALEQYETADTIVLIENNNQSIDIALKPNFGILEIKPAYINGIGKNTGWNLAINDKPYALGEIRLSPNKYSVRLDHKCYENVDFNAGINKGKREVFDMLGKITLKKGGLILSAEQSGEPVSEPVFVNGVRAGETPFSDAVPLCAKVEIGDDREILDVKLKYNEKVRYTHRIRFNEPEPPAQPNAPISPEMKPFKTSFWVALGLDLAGAVLIGFAVYENSEMNKAYKEYNRSWGSGDYYADAWKDAESSRKARNALYVVGGLVLASGIGVHVWF
ncbi:hypothetical protein R83H12_00939 [Fibrobacteria bacterium R8-3-H12]